MSEVPKFHAIVGTMRSGTTLLGHLLAEVGRVRYAGESHVEYDGPDSMRKAWEVIGPELPEEEKGAPGKPFCDKVVVPAQMPEGGRVLIAEAEEIYLLLRHPLAVWRSLKSLEWVWARWEYVTKQLRAMKDLVEEWGWYFGLEEWKSLFYTQKRVRALEIGAFDGVSANMMLDHLFVHPESEVICIDPFLPDPTTPQVCKQTKKDFYENRRRSGHEGRIEIFEGLSVEVLAWMIAEEGYWDSFDFIYIDGSHLAKDVLTDAVMSWNLLKYGGVIAFDDYEWKGGTGELGRPKAGIDAFASVFHPELKLVSGGYRRIWQKLVCE